MLISDDAEYPYVCAWCKEPFTYGDECLGHEATCEKGEESLYGFHLDEDLSRKPEDHLYED